MDLKKFVAIALKDIRLVIGDRAALVMAIAAPLAITFIISAAFAGVNTGNSPIKAIPVVVVNRDTGAAFGPQQVNFGQTLAETLGKVGDLLKVETLADENEARTRVIQGQARAAILIPPDFSQSLNPTNPAFGSAKVKLTLFRDAGSPIAADIVVAVVRQIVNGFGSAAIAVYAAGQATDNPLFMGLQAGAIAQEVGARTGLSGPLTIQMDNVQGATPQEQTFNLLQYFAPALAIFFLNFLMASGAISIMEERHNGTLQRLLTTPTKRTTILAGKLGGTYVSGVLQLAVLIVATSLAAPLLGSKAAAWGTNIPALIVLTLVVVCGSIGLGTIIAGAARTLQQANIYSNAILVMMGILGGTFFASAGGPPMGVLSQLTVNYWATSAYATLARTNDLLSVLPNMVVLLAMFVVFFGTGVFLFNRRLDA
jgi:ABC-2 type transport system permease protein